MYSQPVSLDSLIIQEKAEVPIDNKASFASNPNSSSKTFIQQKRYDARDPIIKNRFDKPFEKKYQSLKRMNVDI
jgi:hypothetical protein